MKSSLKRNKECRVRLVVEVETGRVEERFREVLGGFQKEASLPGFREGRAPVELVEKKFAGQIQEEVLKSLIPEAYHQGLAAHKIAAVSLPTVSDIRYERGKPLTFIAEFDEAPEVPIRGYKGIKIKKVPVDVLPEDVEKGLLSLLESKAELIPVTDSRPVRQGDFIVSDIETWKDGSYKPGKKGVLLYVEANPQSDLMEKVIGARVDEVHEIFMDKKPSYRIWIRGIREKRLPALDEAFARGLGLDSLEQLREMIRKDLAAYKDSQARGHMKEELLGKLLKLVSFDVPAVLIQKQKERLLEQARKGAATLSEEEAFTRAWDHVRLYFILRKISALESIEVNEEELAHRLQALAEESKRPAEEVRRMFEGDLRESMQEAGTINFLLANAKQEE